MKRALFISALFAALIVGTVACDDDVNALTDGTNAGEDKKFTEDKDSTETPPSTKKDNKPSTPVNTPAPKADAGSSKPTNPKDCSATTKRNDCMKCCGVQNNPLTACGCDATTVCEAKCKDNLCSGATPSFECGLCMFQQGCGAADQGDEAPQNSEAAQCVQMCADKPE